MSIKYLISYDSITGAILERRPKNIAYPKAISRSYIEVSEEEFKSTLDGSKIVDVITKKLVYVPVIPVTLAEAKKQKKTEIANARYETETAGITVLGFLVATDDRSKAFIWAAAAKAKDDPSYTVGWKGADGQWVDIGSDIIIAVADAVTEWVERLFAMERHFSVLIDNKETADQVQAVKWSLE